MRRGSDQQQGGHRQRRRRLRHDLSKAATPAFIAAGFELVYDKTHPLGTTDFAPIISEVAGLGADTFAAFSYPPDTFALTQQAVVASFSPKVFYLGVGTAFPVYPQIAGPNHNGVMGIGGVDPDSDKIALLSFLPLFVGPYPLGLGIGILGYGALATAWSLFSGPTRYISLATVAFFGIGAYTVAALADVMPYWLILIVAAGIGLVVALIVGLATLRLAGIYFVIFSFGMAELVRQLVTYYEVNVTRTLGRYVFLPIGPEHIYWQLRALLAITLLIGWWIGRSRLGLALRVIGDDEAVAQHVASTFRARSSPSLRCRPWG